MRVHQLIRIGAWAAAGFFVSFAWGLYFASADKSLPVASAVIAFASLTQPATAIFAWLKPAAPLGLNWAATANAATYAVLGLIVETNRQQHRHLHAR